MKDLFAEDSSSPDIKDVAAVLVEPERYENFARLPSAVVVVCVCVDDRLADDFVRWWLPMDMPNISPLDDPGRELKRFLDIASKLKICARDFATAVGVAGRESIPVRNLKRPYCWATVTSVNKQSVRSEMTHLSAQYVPVF